MGSYGTDGKLNYDELKENLDKVEGNIKAKDIEEFKTSVLKNGGYYIGRYEAGDPLATAYRTDSSIKTTTPVYKQGQYVYNFVTQSEATTLSRNMYKDKNFTSDLVNSYAWDTTIVWIQEFSEDKNYSTKNIREGRIQTGILKDGSNSKDVRCNIYNMAGNTTEWTTEFCNMDKRFCSK